MSQNLSSAAGVIGTLRVKVSPIYCSRRHIPILLLLASGDFCHLLITFANSLDQDQDRQNVGPTLDRNRLINTLI